MPDLSKHLARAKQSFDKGGCDMALEILGECVDVDPTNLDIYKLLIPVAKRKAKERSGKSSFFSMGGMKMPAFSTDPHKQFSSAIKQLGKTGDTKAIAEAMEAAVKLSSSIRGMTEVAIFLGEEFRATGMFSDKVLFQLGHLYYERNKASGGKDVDALDRAIKTMGELERAKPDHPEAGRTVKNWMAQKAFKTRGAAQGADYRSQVADSDAARRQEMVNRIIRTEADAREVLSYVDDDLKKNPADKFLWTKKGDIHARIKENDQARAAFQQALAIDAHDFTVTMKLGDLRMAEQRDKVAALTAGTPEHAAARKQLIEVEVAEYRVRVERQPTDMGHRFQLGLRLVQAGDVDGATGEFQRTVNDPKYKKHSHSYLGHCFTKKNLLDLAIQQYKLFLPLVEDSQSDEAKNGRYQLARLYEDRGNTAEAINEYERLIAVDLRFKDAEARLSKLRGA